MVNDTSDGVAVFFSSLPDGTRQTLLSQGARRHYSKGTTIYARGEGGNSVFFVQTGRVEISVTTADGRVSILNYMAAGDVIGEIAMLDRGLRSADATAVSEVTGVIVNRETILSVLRDDDDAMFAMIAELCAKVRNASDMFEAQRKLSGQARLAVSLLRLAERWGTGEANGTIQLGSSFTQRELGDFAGLSRENVNRFISAWIADGTLSQAPETKHLTIENRATLESFLEA